jgi:hypothetical protein
LRTETDRSLSLPFGRRRLLPGCQRLQQTSQQWSETQPAIIRKSAFSSKQASIKHFSPPGKGRLQCPSKSPWIRAEMPGCWCTCYYFSLSNLGKYLTINNLEARGVEPLFPAATSSNVRGCFTRATSEVNTLWCTSVDVRGCY